LAARWGKIIAGRAFGDGGPGRNVDRDVMEQIAQADAAGLNEGTLQVLLQQQAAALESQRPCPDCGRPCPLIRQSRNLAVRGGPLQQDEPVVHCVASMVDSHSFRPLVAGDAHTRNFYAAARRAFVADGQAYNWTIQQGCFPGFEPIVDFLHLLCYLYAAADGVGADEWGRWSQYVARLAARWQGRASAVLSELEHWQAVLGASPPDTELAASDPRRRVAEAVSYLSTNATRMDYPSYRRQGLPTTSSLSESLVEEFHARVKGSQ
jgi:hypothetical protein